MLHPRELSSLSIKHVLQELQSRKEGLSLQEVTARAGEKNTLPPEKRPSIFHRFLLQFKSPLIFILLIVACITPFIGEWSDTFVIIGVLLFNATIGTIQEGRANAALAALDKAFIPLCLVRRNGKVENLPASEIVVGDIILLNEGTQIPADGRLIAAEGLGVDESILTGESIPVSKTSTTLELPANSPLGDIKNAVFRQTLVVRGHGEMVVSAIGKQTEIGKIASLLKERNTEPPLVTKVNRLSKLIGIVVGLFSVSLFLFGIALDRPPVVMFATIASLMVSLIPEGLPVVLTLVLARGVSRMAEKRAVVKHLNAVEGLGQVDVICTDKTGTLTLNQLNVTNAIIAGDVFTVHGTGFSPEGKVKFKKKSITASDNQSLNQLATICALLGHQATHQTESGEWKALRDPIDAALQTFAKRAGKTTEDWKLIEELPFSYLTKRRAATFEYQGQTLSILAGSPESVLSICEPVKEKVQLDTQMLAFAQQGQRLIAFAERKASLPLEKEQGWIFIGFVSMSDEIRKEVPDSIAWCQSENIHVAMVTGDHPETALAIAKQAGISAKHNHILTGKEVDELTDRELKHRVKDIRVFARISPEHKLRIVQAYRSHGLITAMTGDGVNDAPALQQADIGIAMGKNGTDVAREAADLILLDDKFETIVTAIQEGRAVVGNVRKVITYLFSTSVGEALILGFTVIANLPLPLLPGQILWLNLITDGFLDISLAMEPTHRSRRAERNGSLIDRPAFIRILLLGSFMAIVCLLSYVYSFDRPIEEIQTHILLLMAAFQWFNAWSARSESHSIFQLSPFSNPHLIAATFIVVILQVFATYAPPLQNLLKTTDLGFNEWLTTLALASTIILADEFWKHWHRKSTSTSKLATS